MPFKKQPPLYTVWVSMRDRCNNPRFRQWKDYGGRGIRVCPEWDSFDQFVADMGPRPKGYTLDRADNDGDYTPENCRWASRREQARNQRITRKVTVEGVTYLAVELAERAGIKTDTVVARAKQGIPLAEVLAHERRIFAPGLSLGGKANGARQKSKTHCPAGHVYDENNTFISPKGWRRCRKCRAVREANRRKRLA